MGILDRGRAQRSRAPRSYSGPNLIKLLSILALVWLIIGAVAAGQRGYFTDSAQNCAGGATTAVTVLAGPLNYFGANPKVMDCAVNVPKPSP